MFGQRGTRWARLALATVAGAALTLAAAGPAAAEPAATGVPSTVPDGNVTLVLDGKVMTTSSFNLAVGGKNVTAFCIDFHTKIALGKEYGEGSWDASEVKNLGKVQWVLTHGYPNADPVELVKAAGATVPEKTDAPTLAKLLYFGTQTAVWHFSDSIELGDYAKSELLDQPQYEVVKKIRGYLVANATDQPEPKPSLSISPDKAKTVAVGAKAGPFTVEGPAGKIALSVEGGQAVDANGKPVTETTNGGKFWLTRDGEGAVKVTATGTGSLSFGRVFLYKGDTPAQKLILGGTTGEKVTTKAEADFAQAPAGPSLPVTGDSTTLVIGIGILLLVAGAGTVLIVRRRKVRFTA
jgi:TQXA domain-containing protein/LPXTG-motif cell wall-anchored protein